MVKICIDVHPASIKHGGHVDAAENTTNTTVMMYGRRQKVVSVKGDIIENTHVEPKKTIQAAEDNVMAILQTHSFNSNCNFLPDSIYTSLPLLCSGNPSSANVVADNVTTAYANLAPSPASGLALGLTSGFTTASARLQPLLASIANLCAMLWTEVVKATNPLSASAKPTTASSNLQALLAMFWAKLAEIWWAGPWGSVCALASMLYQLFDKVCLQSRFFTQLLFPFFCVWMIYRLIRLAYDGYQAYVDLGRGGTPTTIRGWCRTLRLKYIAWLDVLQPPRVPPFLDPYRGRLFNLAQRGGPRPTMNGVAPQRQIDQKASPSTFYRLSNMLARQAEMHSGLLNIETSFLEGHLQALRRVVPVDQPLGANDKNGEWEFGGEIAHPHRIDGSMHVVLHPEDVRTVIEAGWGERHPLAIATPFWKFLHHTLEGNRRPVPEYLVILYAPLTAQHYAVFEQIIQAAVWFATGGEVYPVDENTYPVEDEAE
ncbi:hypothetical protein PG995_014169 [Apiospora arundinis]